MRRSAWGAWMRRGWVLCVGLLAGCQGQGVDAVPALPPPSDEAPAADVVETVPRAPEGDVGETIPTSPPAQPPPVVTPPAPALRDARRPQWRGSAYGGLGPSGLTVADFTGDGMPDVAVSATGDNPFGYHVTSKGSIIVLANDGHGGLTRTLMRQELDRSSFLVTTGDVDGDGQRDLLVGGRSYTQVHFGRGTLGWESPTIQHALGSGKTSGAGLWKGVGGETLLWTLSIRSNWGPLEEEPRLTLARVLPDRTFKGSEPLSSDMVLWARHAAVADFNEDGLSDIVFSSEQHWETEYGRRARVFLSDAAGRIVPGASLMPLGSFERVYSADFNRDGHADLLALDATDNSVRVLLGTGQGTFTLTSVLTLQAPVSDVAVVSLDSDDLPDVVALHPDQDAVSLLKGRGDGHFTSQGLLAVGRQPSAAASADMDGDGRPELIVTEADDNTVSVYAVPDAPLTAPVSPVTCPLNPPAEGIANRSAVSMLSSVQLGAAREGVAGDFNADGHMDLAIALEGGGVRLLFHDQVGQQAPKDIPLVKDQIAISLVAGDFDGDGRTDLAGIFQPLEKTEREIDLYVPRILLNDAAAPFTRALGMDGWKTPSRLLAADFNQDGLADLAQAHEDDWDTRAHRRTNLGAAEFWRGDLTNYAEAYDERNFIADGRMVAADFNGDDTLDVIHMASGRLNLNLVAKNGTRLGGQTVGDAPIGTSFFGAVDAEGDGLVDVIAGKTWRGGPVTWWRGDGQGSLLAPMLCTLPRGQTLLAWRDLDADGTADVLSTEGPDSAPTLWVMPRAPGNRWTTARPYILDAPIAWVLPVDLLGDARPELAVMLRTGELRLFPTPEK